MTLVETIREFYDSNQSQLNTYLEATSFLDVTIKYPNSVVIKFGKDKLVGEISVWENNNTESYYECEYFDLNNPNSEPVNLYKQITSETVVDELTKQFNKLYELYEPNCR